MRTKFSQYLRPIFPVLFVVSIFLKAGESHASDLPREGRSTFDHLLATQNKDGQAKLKVPYPFDKLLDLIRSQTNTKSKVPLSVLFIPFGRSLQRFAADPEFFKFPRILVTVNTQTLHTDKTIPLNLRANLYVAYVEPSNMLEVISYNQKAARFEFQVVKNYKKGAEAELYYAPRKLCTSCHEGEIPIFPNEPWTETNDNDVIGKAIMNARGEKNYFGYPVVVEDMKDRIFSKRAMQFDFRILESGKKFFAHQIQKKICGDEPEFRLHCRAVSLKVAFAAFFNYWPGKNWPLLLEYAKIMDRYYKQEKEMLIPQPFLLDRDPFTNENVFGDSHHPPETKMPFKDMKRNIAHLKKNIQNLPEKHDPLKTRLQKVKIVRQFCQLPISKKPVPFKKYCNTEYFLNIFSVDDSIFIWNLFGGKKNLDYSRFTKAIDTMVAKAKKSPNAALAQTYIQRDQLLQEFISAAKNIDPPSICCQKTLADAPKLLPGGIGESSIFNPPLKLLFKYCSQCHSRKSIDYPLQFLYGETEKDVEASIRSNRKLILDSFTSKKVPMPPILSEEHKLLSAKDRELIVKYLTKSN